MKLIFCRQCQDVIRLFQNSVRMCKCGAVGGKYLNNKDAVYFGKDAVPIGFNNSSLLSAVKHQPVEGLGFNFSAFVIPKDCATFKLVALDDVLKNTKII